MKGYWSLEKGKRKIDEKDFMTAYELEGHPDLHISHHYFRDLTMPQIAQVKNEIQKHFAKNPLTNKQLSFVQPEMFGEDKDIRVLTNDNAVPHLDPNLKDSLNKIQPSRYNYRPHISTDTHPSVSGKIKRYYFIQGNGKVHLSIDANQGTQSTIDQAPAQQGKPTMAKTVNAKVENIEVKRPMTGVALQQTGVKMAPVAGSSPSIPVPPKASPTTGKMNNMPTGLQKAEPSSPKPAQQPSTIDYSKFNRPQYSNTGSVPPIHKPLQHSQGAVQGMKKAEDDKFERCVMHVKEQNKTEGKTQEESNPWAICHASLNKADETSCLEKLRKLRKAMPVFQRD
jgi:hypothetical protein